MTSSKPRTVIVLMAIATTLIAARPVFANTYSATVTEIPLGLNQERVRADSNRIDPASTTKAAIADRKPEESLKRFRRSRRFSRFGRTRRFRRFGPSRRFGRFRRFSHPRRFH